MTEEIHSIIIMPQRVLTRAGKLSEVVFGDGSLTGDMVEQRKL